MKDWNDMERIWQYVYSKDQLQTFSEEVRYLINVMSWASFSVCVTPGAWNSRKDVALFLCSSF